MPTPADGRDTRIVAGVDGSPSSLSALRWAIRQARLTGAAVDAVIAWHYPDLAADYGMAVTGTGSACEIREMAEKTMTDAISTTLDPASHVTVRGQVIEGNPVQALLDASADASLLVDDSSDKECVSARIPGFGTAGGRAGHDVEHGGQPRGRAGRCGPSCNLVRRHRAGRDGRPGSPRSRAETTTMDTT